MKGKAKEKALVIVESPSKAKTIGKILGNKYNVVASVGHVRDLPKSKLGIDIENNFEPQYISIRGKGDVIKMLKKEAKAASKIYLATDPDREGEAISWHIAYLLGLDINSPCRIEFHEITKNAVKNAVKNPRPLNINLIDAQQARRVLDRLVGYQISPLLWRKIRRGLSAGRVQSAALKILCDREKEIQAFVPEEYWTVDAVFEKSKKKFKAELVRYNESKIKPVSKSETDKIISELENGEYTVAKVEEKERIKKPMPPFTTSSLQQEAANKLNYNTRRTMMIAQQLYEGVDIKGQGTTGLVTYIRTDSVRISDEAKETARNMILSDYGETYLGTNVYVNKKKDVQDAHEAIRPSNPLLKPEMIKESLTKEQYNLYNMIWCRFTASQMSNAVFDAVGADIECNGYTFRASGSKIKFDGYLAVYDNKSDEDKNSLIPPLTEGEAVKKLSISGSQHFTQPPARYSEASLVKELEEKNIGRPSTYAPIVSTITERRYVTRDKKKLVPTELGLLVNDLMSTYFKNIVDVRFTAYMENRLDDIELEGIDWHDVISKFYSGFEKDLRIADESIEKVVIEDEPTGEMCPECGRPLVKKHGRFGEFIACSGYPECRVTMPVVKKLGIPCPSCGKELVERRSRKGKLFYGCMGYPECNQVYWDRPVKEKCPKCGALMTEKRTKSSHIVRCTDSECGYSENVQES
jgi:DNA topoisomerase-1